MRLLGSSDEPQPPPSCREVLWVLSRTSTFGRLPASLASLPSNGVKRTGLGLFVSDFQA